ncbi:MAG: outer membrane protein assembly factor BamA [Deltaproteobacteria bacterium RBG_16_48_10]|nr:MAG: outer membrane protein assembly factor BamA [Deltaproteobacteria bacterium RBG_16_48_10]
MMNPAQGKRKWKRLKRIGLVPLILLFFIAIGHGADEIVSKITILGNVKVEEGVIRGAVKSREDKPFSIDQVREDLRSIFALGFFTDVQVDIKSTPKGKEVIFIVIEKPSIKDIVIKGNQKVKLDDIKEKLTLKTRSVLNLEKVKENAELIRKLYFSKGYYGVKVEERVDTLETNEVVVTFQITEGPKGHIKKITFKGNKHIPSGDLKKVIQTKEWTLLSYLTKTGILDEDVLKNDVQLVNAYYIDNGYLDSKVSEAKIDLRDPKRIRIEIEITEGPQYHIGTTDFKGDLLTTKEDLFKSLKIRRGDVYRNSEVRKDVNALTEKFANQGFAYVEVNPETSIDSKNLIVSLTFEIEKKKRVSFEKIQISGNAKTRDKVVRRELLVAEGELYNATGLNLTRDRLKRTGYFKEVDLATTRGSTDDKINLDVKVEEAPSGALSFGIGYSSLDKVIGSASVSDRNLFGLGYSGSLRFALGRLTKNFRFSFTDPYFLGYRYSAGTDLYHETREFDTYSYKITGGDIRLGKELTPKLRADLIYKLENINVYNISDEASFFVQAQAGEKMTSALGITFTRDTRDDFFAPNRGSKLSLSVMDAGGILGGDNYFVKSLFTGSWFYPLPLKMVYNLRAQLGSIQSYGGRETPIYEKFFVGGLTTMRGFEYGRAGPVDETGESIGASRMLVFNNELVFPLSREIGLRGAVFLDFGKGANSWSKLFPLRIGYGVGIRWFSPFGPIHIDIGFNPSPKFGEKSKVIDFTAGAVY